MSPLVHRDHLAMSATGPRYPQLRTKVPRCGNDAMCLPDIAPSSGRRWFGDPLTRQHALVYARPLTLLVDGRQAWSAGSPLC